MTSKSGTVPYGIDKIPEFKEKEFKESYGAFYNIDQKAAIKLDYNKLYLASRADGPNKASGQEGVLKKEVENDRDFKRSKKVFFEGKVSDTESVFNAN